MTREEALKYWLPIIRQMLKGTEVYEESLDMAIKALAKEECDDCVSRQAALEQINCWIGSGEYRYTNATHYLAKRMQGLSPVTPQPKMGRWVLAQRDKYIDINCSECGNTRVKEYAYNYTVDEIDMQEIKDLVVTSKMNYCECCGCKMQEVEE